MPHIIEHTCRKSVKPSEYYDCRLVHTLAVERSRGTRWLRPGCTEENRGYFVNPTHPLDAFIRESAVEIGMTSTYLVQTAENGVCILERMSYCLVCA